MRNQVTPAIHSLVIGCLLRECPVHSSLLTELTPAPPGPHSFLPNTSRSMHLALCAHSSLFLSLKTQQVKL